MVMMIIITMLANRGRERHQNRSRQSEVNESGIIKGLLQAQTTHTHFPTILMLWCHTKWTFLAHSFGMEKTCLSVELKKPNFPLFDQQELSLIGIWWSLPLGLSWMLLPVFLFVWILIGRVLVMFVRWRWWFDHFVWSSVIHVLITLGQTTSGKKLKFPFASGDLVMLSH